jgi:RNA polymerase sigma factor (sigma-70 family)
MVQGGLSSGGRQVEATESPDPEPRPFEEFFLANREQLYRALCLVTRNPHEAEDLMQDAFIRVFERWDRVGLMEDPVGYLYRTAMNSFRQLRRRAAVASKHLFHSPAPGEDPFEVIETRDLTYAALATLSRRQRAVVVLIDMLQFPTDEVAAILGTAPSTVRVHLARARAALGDQIGTRDG